MLGQIEIDLMAGIKTDPVNETGPEIEIGIETGHDHRTGHGTVTGKDIVKDQDQDQGQNRNPDPATGETGKDKSAGPMFTVVRASNRKATFPKKR